MEVLLAVAIGLLAGVGGAYLLLRQTARRENTRLEAAELRLRASIGELTQQALRDNSDNFLRLARESFGREQATMEGTLREREAALAQLVEPIRAALEKSEGQIVAMERERHDAFTTLRSQIETLTAGQSALQRETRNLVTALRRPEVRGRWGELTLRRVVELAGLSEHCDFSEQASVGGPQGALRPDLVVHMPDGRDLVIDAKTPLDAYLEAIDATTEELRRAALGRHAQQVEARVRELASKAYWEQFEHSPEFAVLFLPGDQFLSAALAERPELLDNAHAPERDHRHPFDADRTAQSGRLWLAAGDRGGKRRRDPRPRPGAASPPRRLRRTPGTRRAAPGWRGRGLQQRRGLARAPGSAAGATLHGTRRCDRCRAAGPRADRSPGAHADPARQRRTAAMNAPQAGAGAPQSGSIHYFTELYAPPAARALLRQVLALEAEIRTSLRGDLDHAVAHARLEWWEQEAARTAAGSASHPMLRSLQAAGAASASAATLTDWILAARIELAGGRDRCVPRC